MIDGINSNCHLSTSRNKERWHCHGSQCWRERTLELASDTKLEAFSSCSNMHLSIIFMHLNNRCLLELALDAKLAACIWTPRALLDVEPLGLRVLGRITLNVLQEQVNPAHVIIFSDEVFVPERKPDELVVIKVHIKLDGVLPHRIQGSFPDGRFVKLFLP